MSGTSHPEEDRLRVIAWLRSTGRGHKAAAKEFGYARETIRDWDRADKATSGADVAPQPPPSEDVARPRARVRVRPQKSQAPPVRDEPDDWDPETCTRDVWLRRRMVTAMENARIAQERGHDATAARWETIAGKYRDQLDQWNEEQRLAGMVPSEVNLPQASRDVGELLPAFVAVDPDGCESWVKLSVLELAKHKGGVWAQCAELLRGGGG